MLEYLYMICCLNVIIVVVLLPSIILNSDSTSQYLKKSSTYRGCLSIGCNSKAFKLSGFSFTSVLR